MSLPMIQSGGKATVYLPFEFGLSTTGTSSSAAWVPNGPPQNTTQSTIYPVPIPFAIEFFRMDVTLQAAGTTASSGALRYSIWKGQSGSAADTGSFWDHNITSLTTGGNLATPISFAAGEVLSIKQAATGSVTSGAVRASIVLTGRLL